MVLLNLYWVLQNQYSWRNLEKNIAFPFYQPSILESKSSFFKFLQLQ